MTHWKKLTDPRYLGAYAFEPGEEKTATILNVAEESVTGPEGKCEMCTVAHFVEDEIKPLILNATNCKLISKLYRSPYIEDWAGKRIVLRIQAVKAFGEVVDAIRVKPEVPKPEEKSLICADCRQVITDSDGRKAVWIADYTLRKYGSELCAECAAAHKAVD